MLSIVRILGISLLLLIAGGKSSQAALATNCTLYVAANGQDTNSGTSPTAPKTLTGASSVSKPGDVICLLGGTYNLSRTFYPAKNGTASMWIVYKNYGDGDAQFVWTAGASAPDINMFHFFSRDLSTGKSYIEIRGLKFDGQNAAAIGIKCAYSHHLRFVGNTIKRTGAAGIATKFCDYLTADSNKIYHIGYNQGWSSAISYNSSQWLDAAPGFHNFVVNNIISGAYDSSTHHTDGNGIIMDVSNNSYDFSTANTPPALIANNVIYENGGRCIHSYVVTNIWVVNNTCYKNTLDLNYTFDELTVSNTKNIHIVNNIVYAWSSSHKSYAKYHTNQVTSYYKNLCYTGPLGFTPDDPSQFINADPKFVSPPTVHPTNSNQYDIALDPANLGNGLTLQAASPAIDKGVDPTTVPGTSPEIIAGLRQYVFKDITGNPRPQGSGFDMGAYEYKSPSETPPAAPSQVNIGVVP